MRKNTFGLILAVCWLAGAQSVSAQSVDYKNFTYEPSCTAPESGSKPDKITVKNGKFEKEEKVGQYTETFFFVVTGVTYGDVNGDNQDDAIVLTVCNTGGTGNFSEGFVFTSKNGNPRLLTRIEGGDRAYGGLVSTKVENGMLVVERNGEGKDGGACCPEFIITTKYNWKNGKLTAVGKPFQREIYPPTRIFFDKNTSSKQMSAKIPANEMKRFIIGARAGQKMLLTSTMKDVTFIFFKGETDESKIAGGIEARLLKNGDYVFSVANNGDQTNREILFKVEIE